MSAAVPDAMRDFLREHNIHEVECVIADMTGIARGKILPKDLFLGGEHMRLPKSVLLNTVNGEQPNNLPYVGATDPDMVCVPDAATMRVVPWASESVALVIHDCVNFDGQCSPLSKMLGELFVQAFCEVKELEFATFSRVISSWEREHLMLLV